MDTVCPKRCVPACQCKDGYMRFSTDQGAPCVTPAHCYTSCGGNEHIDECGSHCPHTCTNYMNPPVCPRLCGPHPACVCDDGYVRNEVSDLCIRQEQCPPVVPPPTTTTAVPTDALATPLPSDSQDTGTTTAAWLADYPIAAPPSSSPLRNHA